MNQKTEEFFSAAEATIIDHNTDIFVDKKLGPLQTYLIVGTPKALLILAKKIYEIALENKNTAPSPLHIIGSLEIEILNVNLEEIEKLRSIKNRKARRLGLNTLIVVPFWALAAYGAYMLFIKLAGIM